MAERSINGYTLKDAMNEIERINKKDKMRTLTPLLKDLDGDTLNMISGDFDNDRILTTTELEIMYDLHSSKGIREFINKGYYSINCIGKYSYGKFDKHTWKRIKQELKYYKKVQNRKVGK